MKRYPIIFLVICLLQASLCHAQQQGVATIFAERPKVALVLSGGGARGAAHVGVIRLLEEMKIPIDIVTGTSMGAIVGAMYAIGYTADEMDSLLMVQDWNVLLGNGVPRTIQPYALRKAEQQYQVNIPYTRTGRAEATARYRDAGIKVQKNSLRAFPKVLTRPGLIDGQNLLNLFTELTIDYHDSIPYGLLPRAYACVATDLVTGNAVVLDRGFLAESMRASMSIPGVFYPIYKGNQVLVDGGVVNNYPVDVARAMGADIVIGVDLSTGMATPHSLQTFPAIFERLIGTLGSDLRRRNVLNTDILIRPQVAGFPVMGFDTMRLSRLIDVGYATAAEHRDELHDMKQRLELLAGSRQYHGLSVMKEGVEEFVISDVDASEEVRLLLSRQGVDKGSRVTAAMLSEVVEHIYGLGTFASVEYHLLGNGPYVLEVNVTPNPSNQVEMGLHFDSEETAAVLLDIGVNRLSLTGPKLDFTTRLGINPWVEGHAAYAFSRFPQVNASLKYWLSDVNRLYRKSDHAFDYHYGGADVYLSDIFSRYYDLRLGTRYDYFRVCNVAHEALPGNAYVDTESQDAYVGLYLLYGNDLFNASYMPTGGYSYELEAAYNIRVRSREGGSFYSLRATASAALSLSRTTVLQPTVYLRYLLGDAVPFIYGNCIGGYLSGRYLRQQVPFVGFIGCEFLQRNLTVLAMELRQQIVSDIYFSAVGNYAHSTDKLSEPFRTRGLWGMALGLTCNTTIGPLSLYGHWNDFDHRLGAYLSFGYNF